jgi:hypothetical protein
VCSSDLTQDELEKEKIKRFAKDLTLALEATTTETNKLLKNTIAKICKEYL